LEANYEVFRKIFEELLLWNFATFLLVQYLYRRLYEHARATNQCFLVKSCLQNDVEVVPNTFDKWEDGVYVLLWIHACHRFLTSLRHSNCFDEVDVGHLFNIIAPQYGKWNLANVIETLSHNIGVSLLAADVAY